MDRFSVSCLEKKASLLNSRYLLSKAPSEKLPWEVFLVGALVE